MADLPDITGRQQVAVSDCEKMIDWYDRKKRISRNLFYTFQVAAIVLSALIPILILLEGIPKALQALPAAIVSIAVGLGATFKWRESWALRAYTAEALKRELMKYQARASKKYNHDVDEQVALDNFVETIDSLTMNEVSEWKEIQFQSSKEHKKLSEKT